MPPARKRKRLNVGKIAVDRAVFLFKRMAGDSVRRSQSRIGPRSVFNARVFVRQTRRNKQIIR